MASGARTARRARVIAFYLPQFHPIPENDEWWGAGFTEWTNATRARPLFRGHAQPHLPADLGFYDLRLAETREAQAELARSHGVEGFCYYHYWFGGRRILERPFEAVLRSGRPDFPFCLCWANHSWNSVWQGAGNRLLIEQVYPGREDHERHFRYLLDAFRDPRYLTVEGKPLFLLYRPDDVPNLPEAIELWRELAERAGLPGLHLVGVAHYSLGWDPRPRGLDGCALQRLPPRSRHIPWDLPLLKARMALAPRRRLTIHDYPRVSAQFLRPERAEFLDYPVAIPNWDNTPRAGLDGLVLRGATPDAFRAHFRAALGKVEHLPAEHRIVFVKAWNEWAEGNYLEPDLEFGRASLEVVRDEVVTTEAPLAWPGRAASVCPS